MRFQRDPALSCLTPAARQELITTRGLGRVHAEHMLLIDWNQQDGWHSGRIVAYGPLELDPYAAVLHYAQSIFEGMKAYRQADGGVAIFRPYDHARRFQRSARRLALPELSVDTFVEAVEAMVRDEVDWVPAEYGHSLYLRPMMYGSHQPFGHGRATEARFLIIARPVAASFTEGGRASTVWVCDEYSRAAPGGTGDVKTGGNYGGGFLIEAETADKGCDDVVFLDALDHRWIEETGGANLFFVLGSGDRARLLTPPLAGTILPGNTRNSLLELAASMNLPAEEGRISVDQWKAWADDGSLTEVFACGTAAVVKPIGAARWKHGDWTIGNGEPGPITLRLRRALMDIHYGRADDIHHWMHRVVQVAQPSQR